MENLEIYNKLREVPTTAIKPIMGGRLKGMSDINPMWRIKAMTAQFGICGFGWKYEIVKQWTETYGNIIKAFCNINMFVKVDGEWSEPIPGTGGSSLVEIERNGAYVSDECYKMALTDALSVAMKSLGMAADVYFQKDRTKYTYPEGQPQQQAQQGGFKPAPDNDISMQLQYALPEIVQAQDKADLLKIWNEFPDLQKVHEFTAKMTERRTALGISNK